MDQQLSINTIGKLPLKISGKRILRLSEENITDPNDEVQILYFNEKNFSLLNQLDVEYFLNIFIVTIEHAQKLEVGKLIMKTLFTKFLNSSVIFIEEYQTSEKSSTFYEKVDRNFKKVELKKLFVPLCRLKKINFKSYVNFLDTIVEQEVPIVDIDYNLVLNILPQNENLSPLEHAISKRQGILIRLLSLFNDKMPHELLDSVINSENIEVIEALFRSCSSENLKNYMSYEIWCRVRKLAKETNQSEFLKYLQKLEDNFYDTLFYNESINHHIKVLHENIITGSLEKVQNFATKFSDFKCCKDDDNVCALERAIDFREINIYCFLISECFMVYHQTALDRKILALNDEEKEEIRKGSIDYATTNPKGYINMLCNKLDLRLKTSPEHFEDFRGFIIKLSKNEDLEKLFIFASQTDIKIVLDTETESVKGMDPQYNEQTLGLTYYNENKILIGKEKDKINHHATIVHELTHMIIMLLFQNTCLPFREGDVKREKSWRRILKQERLNFIANPDLVEKIIALVFKCYPEELHQPVELAVRVNHITARYIDEPEKVEFSKGVHFKLFYYYKDNVLRYLEMPHAYRIIKLNDVFGVIKAIEKSTIKFLLTPSTKFLRFYKNKIILASNFPQLTLSYIYESILKKSKNHVEINLNNVFVDLGKLNRPDLRDELKFLCEKSNVKFLIISIRESLKENEEELKFLEELKLKPSQKILIICDQGNAENFKNKFSLISINHNWNDLTRESQKEILKKEITFQGQNYKLYNFLMPWPHDQISDEVFRIICNNNKIILNDKKEQISKIFIPRMIVRKVKIISDKSKDINENEMQETTLKTKGQLQELSQYFSMLKQNIHSETNNTFLNEHKEKFNLELNEEKGDPIVTYVNEEHSLETFITATRNENIVLISDQAGSGKTTILNKIYQSLAKSDENLFVSFVGLKCHFEELSKGVGKYFQDFLIKILKFDALEAKVFKEKFSKGEVRILFDAFDEISPECKEETLKLFQIFLDENEGLKNQILITTRPHLEHDLEKILKVSAHKLKNLTDEDQINFLSEIWKSSNHDEVLIKKCAQKLVEKISEMISKTPSVIGLPLIIEGLAEVFADLVNEDFNEVIKDLTISIIYEKIIDSNSKILDFKFPEKVKNLLKKSVSITKVYQCIAVRYFFGEEITEQLGLNYDPDEWSPEEISRSGIVTFNSKVILWFNHETYAEFLVALFLYEILKNSKYPTEIHFDFFIKILNEEKFQITRMFLNDMLKSAETIRLNFFTIQKYCLKFIEQLKPQTLCLSAKEGLFDIVRVLLNIIGHYDSIIFKEIIEFKGEKSGKTTLMEVLPKAKNVEKFSLLLEEIFEFYSEKLFEEFLMQRDSFENTILHHMTNENVELKIVDMFLERIKEKVGKDDLKRFLFVQNKINETFLFFCMENDQIFITCILDRIKEILNEDSQKELLLITNEKGQNVLQTSIRKNEKNLKFIFEFAESLFSKKEMENLLSVNGGDNFLHLAALYAKSKEIFEFLWLKISKIVEDPKEFFMQKGKFDHNVLQRSAFNKYEPEIFSFAFELAENFCETEEEKKNLILEKNSKNSNLLILTVAFATKTNLKFLFEKVFEIFDEKEIKKNLRTEKGFKGRNLLGLNVENENFDSIEFLWNVFEENLSREEIVELFNEEDENGVSFLHHAVKFAKSKEIFEFLWLKIEKLFDDEEKLKTCFKIKGLRGRSLLHISIVARNENSFFYIFKNIFCKFFDLKDFIYECDENGANFLHSLARFGSVSMLEFSFKKLKKNLEIEEIKNFIKMKSEKYQWNLLHCAALQNSNENSINFLLKMIEKFLGKKEIKKMLNEATKFDYFPIHYTIRFNTSEIFEFFTKLYEENFTKEKIKNILNKKDFLDLASKNEKEKNMKENVEKYFKSLSEN